MSIAAFAAFAASGAFTAWLLRHSRIRQLVDRPNERSSHTVPTPRGGGLSIVAVSTLGALALYATGQLGAALAAVLIIGGLSVAGVGFWDDLRSAPIGARMGVHIGAALLAVLCLGAPDTVKLGDTVMHLGAVGPVITVIGIVWALNLFNFMDGIDGIAASEGAFVLLAAAGLGFWSHLAALKILAPVVIAGGACLGFLVFNWPPARIFMGDVGSGYLGYAIAVLALASDRAGGLDGWTWLILGGAFLVDATLTLLRRLLRRERVYQAHRTHAYQWLARRWGSHARVTGSLIAIDLLWLLPCALLSVRYPIAAPWICIAALAPLAAFALWSGAGRPE